MKLRSGGHLSFYMPQRKTEIEIQVSTPVALKDLLQKLHIPLAEVHLVAINGEQADLESSVLDSDEVRIYSSVNGG